MSAILNWPGPKASVLKYPNEAVYGLDVERSTAVYLGDLAHEVAHMPPWDRELAMRCEGGLIVLGSSTLRGKFFEIIELRQQGDGDPRSLNVA